MTMATSSFSSDETLYSCVFNGKATTYHKNEALRMQLLGAECRLMSQAEHITCSMDGVRLDYSREEAEQLLARYPHAICDIGGVLYIATDASSNSNRDVQHHLMAIRDKITIFFPVNSNRLSSSAYSEISSFVHRNARSGYFFTITGYASATGSHSHNHTLSLRRAGIVRDVMLNNGISPDSILSVDALGEESLRHNTPYEFRENRAVEIKAYGG